MNTLEELRDALINIGCYDELIAELVAGNKNTPDNYEFRLNDIISPLIVYANSRNGNSYWSSMHMSLIKTYRNCTKMFSILEVREFLLSENVTLTVMTYRSLNE